MKRSLTTSLLALPLAATFAVSLIADVKTRERSMVKFEGMLGRMVGMFGGKAAKDGLVTSAAVKGDRKATMGDTTSQIVDLRKRPRSPRTSRRRNSRSTSTRRRPGSASRWRVTTRAR